MKLTMITKAKNKLSQGRPPLLYTTTTARRAVGQSQTPIHSAKGQVLYMSPASFRGFER